MYADEAVIARGMALMAEGYSWARVVSTLGLTPGLTLYTLEERWKAMVLGNYVRLEPGVKKRLHAVSHHYEDREITDPNTKQPKIIRVLVFQLDQEDGSPTTKQFSVTSDKLAQQLSPMLPDNAYSKWTMVIIKAGSSFQTEYSLKWEPR